MPGFIRAAIVEDGELCEILHERFAEADQTESLFYGRVQSIRASVGAAFVDIGSELNAFLPLDQSAKLKCGDMLIVQGAAKQTTESKGLRVTNRINLAGKWLVLVPDGEGVHISKKVKDPALRQELTDLGREICPEGCGLIIRTASEDATAGLLCDEAKRLYMQWKAAEAKAAGMTKPGLIHRREPLYLRLVRDIREISQIVINSSAGYNELLRAKDADVIDQQTQIECFDEHDALIFDRFGIEPQIDRALRKRVWLPCGGYLVIDACEAMTVIDVNSGKMILGKNIEDTALRVNLEAAEEAARQIRLRDMNGIIIIDFIDMREDAHRKMLVDQMKSALAADRSHTVVEGMTRLGLMEMTRKRVHAPLHRSLQGSCSYCSGAGELLNAQEVARRAVRQIRRMIIAGQRGPFVIRCAPAAAQELTDMPNNLLNARVYAVGANRHAEKFDIEQIGAYESLPKEAVALKLGGLSACED